ncbi:helix-turn-helix transcriptional regulator [Nitrosomonas sp.]|uniref:helix-turn-helix transcriptional regulator n=1 Tax=Nitrosomonas sp. TaxID=42353 RepID=UPI001D6A8A8D|nr:helix-turn-helix transcriptional regulator [Nitrosomonas sp.]MCB1947388.1 helix-turn-helix transcriptional regulator [Nitrosomonas sp.]
MNQEIVPDMLSGTEHQKTLAIINWLNNCRTKNEFNLALKEALLPLIACNGVFYEQPSARQHEQNNTQPNTLPFGSINLSNCCEHNWQQLMHTTAQIPAATRSAVHISDIRLTDLTPGNSHDRNVTSDALSASLDPFQQQAHRHCAILSLHDEQNQACRLHFCRLNDRKHIFSQRDITLLNVLKSPLLQTLKMILFHEESRNSRHIMDLWSAHSEPVAVIRDNGSTLFQSPAFEHILQQQKHLFLSTALTLIQNIQRKQLEWHSFLSKLGKRLYEIKLTLVSSGNDQFHQTYLIQLSRVTHAIGKIFNQLQRKNLTQRELEIALLIYQGTPTREIAETIHLSYHTVRNHIKSIYSKLGVSSRGEMLVWVG